ncbi:MerR family transcriptional regulator [Nonomuraea sp. NPDC049784]|uniref:MerR family transcriptional regulator n=1 Tax=Nonomuraea sp. NPDC049784 TaxID=3154361 RepID=UPI0033D1DA46
MSDTWTIGELAERAARALRGGAAPVNGRVRDVPGERLIRWYTTIGLVDPPLTRRGRIAQYGRRHLLQLVAVKRLQAAGHSIAQIQAALAGATDRMLEATTGLAPSPSAQGLDATLGSSATPAPDGALGSSATPRPNAAPGTDAVPGTAATSRTDIAPGLHTASEPDAAPRLGGASPPETAPVLEGSSAMDDVAGPGRPARPGNAATPAATPRPDTAARPDTTPRPDAAARPEDALLGEAPMKHGPAPEGRAWPEADATHVGPGRDTHATHDGAGAATGITHTRDGGARAGGETARGRFWADRPGKAATRAHETAGQGATRDETAGRPGGVPGSHGAAPMVTGFRLADGVRLVLDAGRAPTEEDVQAVLAAAGPLLAVLEERELR